jgi:hypothetical protein
LKAFSEVRPYGFSDGEIDAAFALPSRVRERPRMKPSAMW